MGNVNNKLFKRDPGKFLGNHFLVVFPNGQGARKLIDYGGIMNIDLVPGPDPGMIVLENYDYQSYRHEADEQPVKAFYLPAQKDRSKKIFFLDNRCDYMFTDNLSGCLFVAYFDQNANEPGQITVEHLNAYSVPQNLADRAQEVITAQEPDLYYKILSPDSISGASKKHVHTYSNESSVIGVRTSAGWQFYYKPSRDSGMAGVL